MEKMSLEKYKNHISIADSWDDRGTAFARRADVIGKKITATLRHDKRSERALVKVNRPRQFAIAYLLACNARCVRLSERHLIRAMKFKRTPSMR